MIKKEDLDRSLDLFENVDLKENEVDLIFHKFKKILKDDGICSIIKEKDKIDDIEEKDNVQEILEKIIPHLNIKDLNSFLKKLIEDKTLIDDIQDIFLGKVL